MKSEIDMCLACGWNGSDIEKKEITIIDGLFSGCQRLVCPECNGIKFWPGVEKRRPDKDTR